MRYTSSTVRKYIILFNWICMLKNLKWKKLFNHPKCNNGNEWGNWNKLKANLWKQKNEATKPLPQVSSYQVLFSFFLLLIIVVPWMKRHFVSNKKATCKSFVKKLSGISVDFEVARWTTQDNSSKLSACHCELKNFFFLPDWKRFNQAYHQIHPLEATV